MNYLRTNEPTERRSGATDRTKGRRPIPNGTTDERKSNRPTGDETTFIQGGGGGGGGGVVPVSYNWSLLTPQGSSQAAKLWYWHLTFQQPSMPSAY